MPILPYGKKLILSKPLQKGSFLLILFVILSFFVGSNLFVSTDLLVTVFFQSIIPRIFDTPLSIISVLGTFEITTLLLIVLLLKTKSDLWRWTIIIFGFMAILGLESSLKHLLPHPRPPDIFSRYDLPIVFPTGRVETPFAYPSGHMSRTAFLLVVFWSLINIKSASQKKRWQYTLVGLGILMAVSRIYLGEHWATDVVGGTLFGAGIGFVTIGIPYLTLSTQ
jgi:membrane-associated phospholipid phosphatase